MKWFELNNVLVESEIYIFMYIYVYTTECKTHLHKIFQVRNDIIYFYAEKLKLKN